MSTIARGVLAPWVHHYGGQIRSMDVAPVDYKLATCGTDEYGNGVVVIWCLHPMVNEFRARRVVNGEEEAQLAWIPIESQVNAVRWSRCGKFFAAATLDETVDVWEYRGQKIDGDGERQDKYTRIHALDGHDDEVWSVEWSWDGRFLASASSDERVIVWNARNLPEQLAVLDCEGHGPVKGLSFDPIGRYLASQSADKTMKIWKCNDEEVREWQLTRTIEEPEMKEKEEEEYPSPFSLASTRPEWTPDGMLLAAPRARNGTHPTAKLISRDEWSRTGDLVVPKKSARVSVAVVRCTPRCFNYEYNGEKATVSLFAVCSTDRSLSVWAVPGRMVPLATFPRFFDSAVMDVVWRDAVLFCCSGVDTVKVVFFDDVGTMMGDQQMSDICSDYHDIRPSQYSYRDGETDSEATDEVDGQLRLICDPSCAKLSVSDSSVVSSKSDENLESSFYEESDEEEENEKEDDCESEAESFLPPPPPMPIPIKEQPERKEMRVEPTPKKALPKGKKEMREEPMEEAEPVEEQQQQPPSAIGQFRLMRAETKNVWKEPLAAEGATIGGNNEYREEESGKKSIRVIRVCGQSGSRKIKWTATLKSPIVALIAHSEYTVVGTKNAQLIVLNSVDGEEWIRLKMDSSADQLGLDGPRCCVITHNGFFHCWDLQTRRAMVMRVPVRDVVRQGTLPKKIVLSETGSPQFTLSDGSIYEYSEDLLSWVPVLDCPMKAIVKEELMDEEWMELMGARQPVPPTNNRRKRRRGDR